MLSFGSVCSGIESASVGLRELGFKADWFSEIEPFPCALLKYRFPLVTNYGDMNFLPLLIRLGVVKAPPYMFGGTPCQAFSVIGGRQSLGDARGNLTLKYVEVINAIDSVRTTPTIAVWENVPGVLSTKDNAFGCFLGELAGSGHELQPGERPEVGKSDDFWRWDKINAVHVAKWPNAGSVHGPTRSIAWRVIDAQYFGLAESRRRVFLIASARKDFDPEKILFEYEGVRRDVAPIRDEGESFTGVPGTGYTKAGDYIIFEPRSADGVPRVGPNQHVCPTLNTMQGGQREPCIADSTGVRKLTPVECERLQGFHDNWTLLPFGKKQKADAELQQYYETHLNRKLTEDEYRSLCSDGPRYKAIGNSKATNCVRWLGERLIMNELGLL